MDTRRDLVDETVSSFRVLLGIAGVVAAVVGVLILAWPDKSGMFVAAVLAVYAIIAGLVYAGVGLFARNLKGWSRVGHVLLGVLYVIAGIVVLTNLSTSTALLALLVGITVGIVWIIEGIVALTTLPNSPMRGWTIFYAIVSLLGGLTLIVQPLFGAAVLWWLLGIALVVLGIVQVVRAIQFKSV